MRRIFPFFILIPVLFFTSCIKEADKKFTGKTVIEFDAAVLNSATSPYSYFVSARNPAQGIPTPTSAVAINRAQTTPVILRVNLVGTHRDVDEVLTYKVLTPTAPGPVAPNMLAVSGTHFSTGTTFTIPKGSSFGEIKIDIINPGTSSTNPREVHLELVGNDNVKPSENYKKVAIRIAQN